MQELRRAENELVKCIQRKHFSELFVLPSANEKKSKSKLPRFVLKLNPILVDCILRVGGRLRNAPADFDSKHPTILPSDSHFTELIIKEHHLKVGHSGVGHTWSSLRQTFWIVKGSSTVRRVLGNCMFCRKRNAPVGSQLMADLPHGRLQVDKPPFSHVGIDYFGALLITQGRSQVKRFIARRGAPDHIYSDNGTNFVGATKILRDSLREWNQHQINDYLRQQEIRWTFNPPTASHMGGSWERMIRSVRRILSSLLTSQSISEEVLQTAMTKVEWIINSRPLVPITLDPKNEEPLTPNHLLLLKGNPNVPPGLFDYKDCYVRRRWAQVQYIADQFWRRWTREFLPNLNHRQKWFQQRRNAQKDDLVLLVDDTLPRSRWSLGCILEVFPDKNGLVRTVLVKSRNTLLKRPITKLCLILRKEE